MNLTLILTMSEGGGVKNSVSLMTCRCIVMSRDGCSISMKPELVLVSKSLDLLAAERFEARS